MKLNELNFFGSDCLINADELDAAFMADLLSCHHSGDCEDDVICFMQNYRITGDESDCADYLRGYGAWDDDELKDHAANLKRLVWLAACDLDEQGEIYFSTYG